MTKRALLLISDTGGGHRSAANAIVAALDERLPKFETRIEDVAAHCAFPLTQLGLGYSMALRYAPPVYGALYYATNGRRRYRALVRFCEPLYRERLRDLFLDYRPDVIVSVHPLLNHAALRARDDAHMQHVPVVTVITDLGKVHESWLVPEADAVVVPARDRLACACSAIRFIRNSTTSRAAKPICARSSSSRLPPLRSCSWPAAKAAASSSRRRSRSRAHACPSSWSSSAVATKTSNRNSASFRRRCRPQCRCLASPIRFPNIFAPSICSLPRRAPERSPRPTPRSFRSSSTITFRDRNAVTSTSSATTVSA